MSETPEMSALHRHSRELHPFECECPLCVPVDDAKYGGERIVPAPVLPTVADVVKELAAVRAERDELKARAAEISDCLALIYDFLHRQGCEHPPHAHAQTPLMMYPEWIACTMRAHAAKLVADLIPVACAAAGYLSAQGSPAAVRLGDELKAALWGIER